MVSANTLSTLSFSSDYLRCISLAVGHVLTSINGVAVNGGSLEDGRNVKEILENAAEFPLTLKFTRPKMTTNEKIFLASMFYPLFAIASQLSPEPKSSGIEILEADTFKLQCFQTLTGENPYFRFYLTQCFIITFSLHRCEVHGRGRDNTHRRRHFTQAYLRTVC